MVSTGSTDRRSVRALPKAHLHLHFTGSMRHPTLLELAARDGIALPDQLVEDRHLLESGGLVDMQTDDGGLCKVALLPLLMGGRRPGVRMPLPAVGQHTDEVLASLRFR